VLPSARRASLLSELEGREVVSTDVLASKLGVSEETIRRDIALLKGKGMLIRVHGGAMRLTEPRVVTSVEPFDARSNGSPEIKSRIGGLAAKLLKNGDIIAIDTGTTALQVALALPAEFTGVVATPSLLVAAALAGRPGIDVLVSGGSVRAGDLTCSNVQAKAFFRDLHTDIVFLSSGGVSATEGLTDFYRDEVPVRQAMLKGSKRSYIVAESAKMEKVAPYHVCDLADVDGLITDAAPPVALEQRLQGLGVELLLPESFYAVDAEQHTSRHSKAPMCRGEPRPRHLP
jgi:DeoR family fructose operon transcriptional repressor